MKIRNGFVSNSSSSSFVVLGTVIGKNMSYEDAEDFEVTMGKKIKNRRTMLLYPDDIESSCKEFVFGYELADMEYGCDSIKLPELTAMLEELSNNLEIDSEEFSLYYGVRGC